MTPKEKQEAFDRELTQLLKKYNAEIVIENKTTCYSQHYFMQVDFEWDESMIEEHNTGVIPSLLLGSFKDGNSE